MKKVGIWCPATRANCDRPCLGAECQRVKLAPGSFLINGGVMEDVPRPPDPDVRPILTPAQCRAARAYLDLTLFKLGEVSGVSAKAINKFEKGRTYPHEETLRRLLGAFYDLKLEVFGARDTARGIRDFSGTPSKSEDL